MRKLFLLLLIAFTLSQPALAENPLAGFTYMSPSGKNPIWETLPVKICASKKVPQKIKDQLKEAVEIWNKSFKKEFFHIDCELPDEKYSDDVAAVHGVYWITDGFEKFTEKTSLARTVTAFDDSGKMRDADILLNGQFYDWNTLPIDAKTVLVHELGHVLGLKHFFLNIDSAMNYYPYVAGYIHQTLGEYERIVISNLYLKSKLKVPAYLRSFFKNQLGKAIESIERLKMKTGKEYYALGILYKSIGKFSSAKSNFQKALEQQPKSDFIRLQLGDALWSMNEIDAAETEFLKIVEENPKNYEALANLGSINLSKRETSKGIEFLKKSLAVQPAHWVACSILFKETKDEKFEKCANKYGPQ